jgi:hypothetical protein
MRIKDHFMRRGKRTNNRIEIISNNGNPVKIPKEWRPVLSSCDTLVVIPDMHMYIRNSPLDNFKFGAEAMLHFLDYLGTLKEELALKNKTLRVYQLGDVYEMRFPSVTHPSLNANAAEIRLSHPDYDLIINMMDHLRTHMLYGNHDFELRHFPSFRFYALEGKVYLEHGFAPSPWSENPASPFWEPAQLGFKLVRDIESFFLSLAVSANLIGRDEHYALGVTDGSVERGDYPSDEDYPEAQRKYYVKRMEKDPDARDIRVSIIGHTHHPYLEADIKANGEGHIFVDAGAWSEGRSDFAVMTDEEVAICHYKRRRS